jgi:hypothetical protein
MCKIILGALMVSGLMIGASTVASASPATPMFSRDAAIQNAQVQQIDYYYNHHRYKHRSWSKKHHRWRYY